MTTSNKMSAFKASILVVDDESNIRMMLRTTLGLDGYEVRTVSNGREAMEAIIKRPPDLMVLDLSMPVLDGMGLLQELKALKLEKKPRVVVLTAYGSIPAAVKAVRLGAMDFLEKPITPDILRQTVADVLSEELLPEIHSHDEVDSGYEGILDRVRKALRMAEYSDAQSLLLRAADLAQKDPAYYNLMGIIYESRRRYRLARKFYSRALSVKEDYEPARANLQRLAELQSSGHASTPILLGDSLENDVWMARLPEGKD